MSIRMINAVGSMLGFKPPEESDLSADVPTIETSSKYVPNESSSKRYAAPSASSPMAAQTSLRNSFRASRVGASPSFEDSPSKKTEDPLRIMMNALSRLLAQNKPHAENEFEISVATLQNGKENARLVPFLTILKKHGWVKNKFEEPLDIPLLHREMGTVYLSIYDPNNQQLIENFWNKRSKRFDRFILERNASTVSFCPNILLEYLETAADSFVSKEKIVCGVGVRSYSFTGAVMFVDISGFTSFCIEYCSNGTAGLDELHKICNGFLGRVVQLVYGFNGDVISFAGDALICVFKQNPSDALKENSDWHPSYLVKALQCSMVLANLSTDKLSVHIGLSCGKLFLGSVGGYRGQWTYLLNGKCITELSSCLDDAGSKQVVMTPQFYDEVITAIVSVDNNLSADNLEVQTLSSGNVMASRLNNVRGCSFAPLCDSRFRLMNMNDSIVDMVSHFVPEPVLPSIAIDHLNTIDELREVTTMFLKLDSFSHTDHCDPINLQAFYYGAQEALFENGGFLRQFLIDDKGCILIAMWGVPSFSYTDNEVRVIDTVTAIQSLLPKIGHSCSVGIASGNVYCGVIGSVSRRDFVGIGDKVNLAARLMGKAKGRVLIDMNTYNRLPLLCKNHCQGVAEMKMKGLQAFVKAYSVDFRSMPSLHSAALAAESSKMKQKYVRYDIALRINEQIDKMELAYSRVPSRMNSTKYVALNPSESVDQMGGLHQSFDVRFPPLNENSGREEEPHRSGSINLIALMEGPQLSHKAALAGGDPAANPSGAIGQVLAAQGSVSPAPNSGSVGPVHSLEPAPQRSTSISFADGASNSGKERVDKDKTWASSFASLLYNHKENSEDDEMGAVFTIIAGPAGSGKSAVHKYFKKRALSRQMTYHLLRCKLGDENVVFGVITRLVLKLIEGKVSSYAEQTSLLKKLLLIAYPTYTQSDILLKLGIVHRILFGTDDFSMSYSSKRNKEIGKEGLQKDGSLSAILSVLLAKRCYALVITDAQFCDELSWQLLRSTLEFPVHVCIMMTIRQEIESKKDKSYTPLNIVPFGGHFNPSPAYYAITDHPNTALLFMDKMSEDEVGDLLREILNCSSISSSLVSSVYNACNGNQYWCKTVAKFILEQGYQRVENAVTADKTVASSLPALIVAMYERLPVTQQIIIKHASVIGDEFSAEQLMALLPALFEGDQGKLKSLCQPLMDNGFLTILDDDDGSGHLYYQLPNHFIRSVIYDLVPRSDAGKVHLQIATHIESVFGDNIVDHYPSLIYHYSMSPDGLGSALKYTLNCAEQVILCGAYSDGLVQLNHAFNQFESLLSNDQFALMMDLIDMAVADMKGGGSSRSKRIKARRKDDVSGYLTLKLKLENFLPTMRLSQKATLRPIGTMASISRMASGFSFTPTTSARSGAVATATDCVIAHEESQNPSDKFKGNYEGQVVVSSKACVIS